MKVVHYLFGLPPVRTGGVPRYVLDLMDGQKNAGCNVNMLIPGVISVRNRDKVGIRRWKVQNGIHCYRIYNPQYIPNGYGIQHPEQFMRSCPIKVYKEWLEEIKPDILHIHSLMGLHMELLKAAKILKLPIIYTPHDYFGLCPKIDLLKGEIVCQEQDWTNCWECCSNAFDLKRLAIEQSEVYRWYCGNNLLVNLVHSNVGCKIKGNVSGSLNIKEPCSFTPSVTKQTINQYLALEHYYQKCLSLVDWFHFNSQQTQNVFVQKLKKINGQVIQVRNKGIVDNRKNRYYGQTLRLGYLGSNMQFKGYNFLLDELKDLYRSGRNDFCLNTYMLEGSELPFIKNHRPYSREQLPIIFDEMDVLVVPSVWKETYGMVVIEALSYGVPVLVSENVGAKMLLEDFPGVGRVFPVRRYELTKCLIEIYDDRILLKKMNQCIVGSDIEFDYSQHVQDILNMYSHVS